MPRHPRRPPLLSAALSLVALFSVLTLLEQPLQRSEGRRRGTSLIRNSAGILGFGASSAAVAGLLLLFAAPVHDR